MQRRECLAVLSGGMLAAAMGRIAPAADPQPKFKLRFAPHPGMFKELGGNSVIDQIKFAADQGFTAWEDNGMMARPVEEQEQIGQALADAGMKMGVFVAYGSFDRPTFVRRNDAVREEVLSNMRKAVEVAKRVQATYFTVVPGSVDQQHFEDKWVKGGGPRLREGMQTANAIDLLRRCAEVLEPHKLVMVLEPLNWEVNHGGTFLRSTDQAYAICKAVNSPACKILYDVYHEQITAGNIINTMNACWDEIGYMQTGDNPGRKEPYTGEMNYRNIFAQISKKNPDIIIGMEHGNSKPGAAGEQAVIDAYRLAQDF